MLNLSEGEEIFLRAFCNLNCDICTFVVICDHGLMSNSELLANKSEISNALAISVGTPMLGPQ